MFFVVRVLGGILLSGPMPLQWALICLALLEQRIYTEDSPNTITFNLFASRKCVQKILISTSTLISAREIYTTCELNLINCVGEKKEIIIILLKL